MDKKSQVLLWIFLILILASVIVTFDRYMIKQDYLIYAHTPCDPNIDRCFYTEPEEGSPTEYYQKIYRKAYNIPDCDPSVPECTALTCPLGEASCELIACSEEVLDDGEFCSTP